MNNFIKKPFLTALFLLLGAIAFAQAPPPPPAGGHGVGGNQPAGPGGGAPIGGGLAILLSLGAAYGGGKIYRHWKSNIDGELED